MCRSGEPSGRVLGGPVDAGESPRGHRGVRPRVCGLLGPANGDLIRRRDPVASRGGDHRARPSGCRRSSGRRRGRRRRAGRHAALEPEGDPPAPRLRAVHAGRVRRGAPAHERPAPRRRGATVAAAQAIAGAPRRTRSAPDRTAVDARGRRAGRARVSHLGRADPAARPAARRERLDGALRAPSSGSCTRRSSAVRASRRSRWAPASRGSRASSPRAIPTRRCAPPAPRCRLVGRDPPRRRCAPVQRRVGDPRSRPRRRGRDLLRRLGSGATPRCSPSRWRASSGSRTASSG